MGGRRVVLVMFVALVFFNSCKSSSSLPTPSSSDRKTSSMQSLKKTMDSVRETRASKFPQYGAHHDIPYAVVLAGGGGGGGRGGGGGGGGRGGGAGRGGKGGGGRSGGGSGWEGGGETGGEGTEGSHRSSGEQSVKSLSWMSAAVIVMLTALYDNYEALVFH